MPTLTDNPPAQDIPQRNLLTSKASALSIVLASVATLAIVFLIVNSSSGPSTQVQSVPAQPDTVSQRVAAPAKPALPTVAQPPPAPVGPATDVRGFVDSEARCDPGERAAAIARTARSVMVVCDDSGSYRYRGIRLRDGAFLELDDVRPFGAGFEAHNGGTTYRLSPTELVVLNGESLQSRDAILEFRVG